MATRARTIWDRCRMPPAGLELDLDPIADHEQPDPVAVMGGRRRQERRGLRGAIGLGSALGAEPHARRDVEHQPERQRPLLDEPPDERLPLPGRDVPVEVPHVVARLVGAELRERQSHPRPGPVIGPRQLRDRFRPDPEPQPPRPPHDLGGVDLGPWRFVAFARVVEMARTSETRFEAQDTLDQRN